MSETAISPQIVSEAVPAATGAVAFGIQAANKTPIQASEFNKLFGQNLLQQEQSLLDNLPVDKPIEDLNQLFNSTILPSLQPGISGLNNGNALPAGSVLDDLAATQSQAKLQPAMPLEGQYKSTIGLLNNGDRTMAVNNVAVNPLVTGKEALASTVKDDLLATELTASFTEKNIPNVKLLNAQMLNQFMNHVALKQQPVVDNTVLAGAAPGMFINQSLSVHSSEAVLPAISVSPDNPQWNAQVGERINWMVNNAVQRAEIRLDPPELGNLDIRLNVAKDNQASILIHVSNATAKDAIESSIPRLREMFEQQGLDLANVDVSQQDLTQQQSMLADYENNDSEMADPSLNPISQTTVPPEQDAILATTNISAQNSENLLDIFA